MLQRRLGSEDLPIDEVIHLGSHTVSEEEIIRFANDWDPQYFHTDPVAAQSSDFGGLIASGIHTLGIAQRLSVQAFFSRYDVIAGRSLNSVRFLRPVRAGTVLSGQIVVTSVEPHGPGRARFISRSTLLEGDDPPVLTMEIDSLIRSHRDSASGA